MLTSAQSPKYDAVIFFFVSANRQQEFIVISYNEGLSRLDSWVEGSGYGILRPAQMFDLCVLFTYHINDSEI